LRVFFFQAEDGIRDDLVTGVQTCALPICALESRGLANAGLAGTVLALQALAGSPDMCLLTVPCGATLMAARLLGEQRLHAVRARSEERRVGEEGSRSGGTEEGERGAGSVM